MTDFHLDQLIVPAACYGAGLGTAWLFGLRGKISDIVLSRAGLRIHTNSGMVVYELTNKIEQIDTTAQKGIRKATETLTILPPETYGTATEVMLINMKANLPLLHASYENHHTRELRSHGAEGYIEDKTSDIVEAVRVWIPHYPELPALAESLVHLWIKKALIPNLRKACTTKLEYYRKLYERTDIIETLKIETKGWITKNEKYIECIEELAERLGFTSKPGIINP